MNEKDMLPAHYNHQERMQTKIDSLESQLKEREGEIGELVKALELAKEWVGCEDANEDFEMWADRFYKATGYLRPGKDVPASIASEEYDSQRKTRYQLFVKTKEAEVRMAIKVALAQHAKREQK